MEVIVRPCGPSALLLDVAAALPTAAPAQVLDAVLALDAAVREYVATGQGDWRHVVDVVPASGTILITVTQGRCLDAVRVCVRELAAGTALSRGEAVDGPLVRIPVVYDGPDLAQVAMLTGLTAAQVVAAHTARPWRVAFAGFAPGFAYLTGGDPRLEVPRRAEPRTQVPTGAVGLAGLFSGVYPAPSPGGWQLIGHTRTPMWQLDRARPALLEPGDRVLFEAVRPSAGQAFAAPTAPAAAAVSDMSAAPVARSRPELGQ